MMLSTPKSKSELFLASSLRDGLEDSNLRQVTTLLKSKEADPNVLLPTYGISPFHLVIGNESERFAEEVTKLFLRHGGNPNVRAVDGMTPVHVAAAWGRVKVLELLLANGGDPVCLDDDGRTPFHYAFDGSYYDAITVLGKYCTKSQDDDDDSDRDSENDEKPKVEIKLEKILVNRGNLIAEYVPSDIERSDDTLVSEDKENIKMKNLHQFSEIKNESSSFKSSSTSRGDNASSFDENVNINRDNITYRRSWRGRRKESNAISPILPVEEDFDFDIQERNESEEKVLIGKIIRRLSSSFSKINRPNNMNENNSIDNKKKFLSLIPQPKFYKNNLKCMEKKTPSAILDNSIVSKSPNFRISLAKFNKRKTPPSLNNNKYSSYRSKNIKLKNFNNASSRSPSPRRIKSASSTPRRRINRMHKSTEKPVLTVNTDFNKIKISLNKTYSESDYDIPYSLQDEKNHKAASRRVLSENVARKLDDSNDEDYGINVNAVNNNKIKVKQTRTNQPIANGKSTKLSNKVDIKTILGTKKIKKTYDSVNKISKSIKTELSGKLKTPKAKSTTSDEDRTEKLQNAGFVSIKNENRKCFFQSPGSSNPTSVNSSFKSNLELEEEMKLFDELQEIYQVKGKTPPASVSNFTNDSSISLEAPTKSSENTEDLLFFDCEGVNSIKQNLDDFQIYEQEDCTKLEPRRTFDSDSDVYRTPMRSSVSSRCSNESFVSVDEEYAYVDAEKNVAFLERRLRVFPITEDMDKVKNESTWLDRLAELSINSCAISSKHSSRIEKETIGNNTLRSKLISLGEVPGPITHTTYNLYLKRLRKLEQKTNLNDRLVVEKSYDEIPRISKIPINILTTDWISDIPYYQDLEDQVFREYERPNPSKKYRGGLGKTSFNYLLLDSRITKDLPRTGRNLSQNDRWKRFLEAVFYIGKGKAARPAQHLYNAFDIWIGKKQVDEPSEKIQKIISIWREERGVVCLHVFMNTMQEEAFTREAAMIDALGNNHLSNCNRGNYYGILSTMSNQEKRSLGKYLLYKAMEIFMFEGERQIFPRSIS